MLDAHANQVRTAGGPIISGNGFLLPDQDAFDDAVLASLDELASTPPVPASDGVVLDLPYAQIARALDIPEGTAASHVHRARGIVRDRLAVAPPARPNHRTQGGRP